MQSHSMSLYDELIKQLELMEDKVADYCLKKGTENVNLPSLFASTHTEIILIIMKFHDKNKFV